MADNNTCSICLEPLLQSNADAGTDVGAVIPCGHCFHMQCFGLWKASRGSGCKCPNCNKPSKQCIKIFIAPPEDLGQEEDDISWNSVDTTNPEEDEDKNSTSETRVEGGQPPLNEDEDDDVVEIVDAFGGPQPPPGNNDNNPPTNRMVDLTQSPPPRRSESVARAVSLQASTTQKATEPDQRIKAIAKRYKKRFQQKDLQFREQYQQYQALLAKHSDTKDELNEIKKELLEMQELEEEKAARIDGLKLEMVRLKQRGESYVDQIAKLQHSHDKISSEYTQLQKSFKMAVEKARSSDMAEVQQLMEEHPKLLHENQQLKIQVGKATSELSTLRQQLRRYQDGKVLSAKRSADENPLLRQASSEMTENKKRKASDAAKVLRAMGQVQYASGPVPALDDLSSTSLPNGLSAVGNRMRGHFQKSQLKQQATSRMVLSDKVNTGQSSRPMATTTFPPLSQRSERITHSLDSHTGRSQNPLANTSLQRNGSTGASARMMERQTSINLNTKKKSRPLTFLKVMR